ENLTDAIASGLLRASPALAQRLVKAEDELARLQAAKAVKAPAILLPNLRKRWLEIVDGLDVVLAQDDPDRGREELRGILGERIKVTPDISKRFLWADYSLGMAALLPTADLMVAGAGFEPATFGL